MEKTISYLNVTIWLKKKSPEEIQAMVEEIAEDLLKGGEIYGTKVYKSYPLKDFEQAFKDSIEFASLGKTLFKPHDE